MILIGQLKREYYLTNEYDRVIYIDENEFDSVHYYDISSNIIWHNQDKFDYIYKRDRIKERTSNIGFDNMDKDEKDMAIEYCAININSSITYLIERDNLTLNEATLKYYDLRCTDIKNAADACSNRINNPIFIKTILLGLGQVNAEIFLDSIRNFIYDYEKVAFFGTNYGNSREGIMDYIEATGIYENSGLSTYEINQPFTYETLKEELINILVKGKIN